MKRENYKTCAECGERLNHLNHPGDHTFKDASKGGMNGISSHRREYLASDDHKRAYAAVEPTGCMFEAAGAPGECSKQMTPHHVAPRSVTGDLAESDRWPIIVACSAHNSAVEGDPGVRAWAERARFVWHVDGNEYPYRFNDRTYRAAKRQRAERANA